MAGEGRQAGSRGVGVAAKGMYECSAEKAGCDEEDSMLQISPSAKEERRGRSQVFITHQRGRGSHHREQKAVSKDAKFGAHFTQMYTFSEGFKGG
jgi:hypothetical protein